jgi:hypothetical protein
VRKNVPLYRQDVEAAKKSPSTKERLAVRKQKRQGNEKKQEDMKSKVAAKDEQP